MSSPLGSFFILRYLCCGATLSRRRRRLLLLRLRLSPRLCGGVALNVVDESDSRRTIKMALEFIVIDVKGYDAEDL